MASVKRVDDKGRKLPDGFSQRPDGRYMARFTHEGQRITIYDKNLNTLKEKVDKKKYELKNRISCKNSNLTVNQWYEYWLESYYAPKVRPATISNRTRIYKKHIKPTLGNRRLQSIEPIDIRNLCLKLNDNVSYGIAMKSQNILKQMFEAAKENQIVLINPAENALKGLKKPRTQKKKILTSNDEKRFLKYIKDNYYDYFPYFVVAFFTGLRPGEIHGLTWKDIDFENQTIEVNKTLWYEKVHGENQGRFHAGPPKTENSKRKIPMLPEVSEALRIQKELLKTSKYDKEQKNVDGYSDFVFLTRWGSPLYEGTATNHLKTVIRNFNNDETIRAVKKGETPNLIEDFSLHAMRHTFATRCFEAGIKPKAVQEILGHAHIQMTMDLYTHVSENIKKSELALLGEMNILEIGG